MNLRKLELNMADKYNASRNATRQKRMEAGLCRDCGQLDRMADRVTCFGCYELRQIQGNRYKAKLIAESKCTSCRKVTDGTQLCYDCTKARGRVSRERRKATKELVFDHFGGKCNHCGVSDIRCLTLDHIDGDGYVDCDRGDGKRMQPMVWYARLRRSIEQWEPLPKLQILCFNCHAIKDLKHWWDK